MNLPTPILAGNWKLNLGPDGARTFFRALLPELPRSLNGTVLVMPPAISFTEARAAAAERPEILLGVQNVYWEESGAYTGEISPSMAAEAGARAALVGHSERRHVFGETSEETARKVTAVIRAGLFAILCVGEKLESREAGRATHAVDEQLEAVLHDLPGSALSSFVVAYEPVWAIGTGRTASPADASQMHAFIRDRLRSRYGREAEQVPILYGGSVKPDNASQLLAAPGVDGLLIGGASVDPNSFARICDQLA